mmetsp:Transcript_76041/g.213197  ORF Transcript_76041/g.213197 Transcript_76041/m.213197 type:complete len:123 (-) Transcript_76041:155-523(-)
MMQKTRMRQIRQSQNKKKRTWSKKKKKKKTTTMMITKTKQSSSEGSNYYRSGQKKSESDESRKRKNRCLDCRWSDLRFQKSCFVHPMLGFRRILWVLRQQLHSPYRLVLHISMQLYTRVFDW